ncbi:MAG TPA: hypothetical protein VM711_00260, partial [Sphingomicrobium sp.]|nr:hypothetical protein [Sphingomicrobium sp.]
GHEFERQTLSLRKGAGERHSDTGEFAFGRPLRQHRIAEIDRSPQPAFPCQNLDAHTHLGKS